MTLKLTKEEWKSILGCINYDIYDMKESLKLPTTLLPNKKAILNTKTELPILKAIRAKINRQLRVM